MPPSTNPQPVFVPEAPFSLPQAHRAVLERALRGEAWLKNLGVLELVTAVANPNMQVFAGACERLSLLLGRCQAEGFAAGEAQGFKRGVADGAALERRRLMRALWACVTVAVLAVGSLAGVLLTVG